MHIINGHSIVIAGTVLTIKQDDASRKIWVEQSGEVANGHTEAIKVAKRLLLERAMRVLGLGWSVASSIPAKVLRLREGSGY